MTDRDEKVMSREDYVDLVSHGADEIHLSLLLDHDAELRHLWRFAVEQAGQHKGEAESLRAKLAEAVGRATAAESRLAQYRKQAEIDRRAMVDTGAQASLLAQQLAEERAHADELARSLTAAAEACDVVVPAAEEALASHADRRAGGASE